MAPFGKRKAEESASDQNEEDHRPAKRDRSAIQVDPQPAECEPQASSESELLHVLDFSTLTSEDRVIARFDELARKLLSGSFHLVISNSTTGSEVHYQFLEIEFYLWMSGCHEDPFTHGSEEQRISGRWYFHRAPKRSEDASRSLTSGGYRGGTRKGLDLTLGSVDPTVGINSSTVKSRFFDSELLESKSDELEDQQSPSVSTSCEIRGGILLRSMKRLGKDEKVISGPSLLVDEVLRQSSSNSNRSKPLGIAELVDTLWGGDISAFSRSAEGSRSTTMFLQAVDTSDSGLSAVKPVTIHRSPRIGLELSHPGTLPERHHPRVVYLDRRYRYFVHPQLLTANGRVQTFLGILDDVQSEGVAKGKDKVQSVSKERIAELTGLKTTSVANYLNYYLEGHEGGNLKSFVGPAGKGACSSPATYLRMMGTLARVLRP
ncbi:hypothetical protein PM082_012303 [Marasmius tenuissimus]|nr:hypothetical protein PM082_012303 [Marasmius tenuissimus]